MTDNGVRCLDTGWWVVTQLWTDISSTFEGRVYEEVTTQCCE